MKIKRVEHIAVAVKSLNQSMDLLRNTFGIPLEYEEQIGATRLAMLPVGETYIELLESGAPKFGVNQWIAEKGEGLFHICFEVEDIDGALTELKAKGVKLRDETPRIGHGGARIAFIDPASTGNLLIELAELPASSGFTHPEYLVETEWLAQNLNNPEVLVLDCTTHLIPDPKITYQVKPGREDFETGHIPGALFVDMLRDVSDTSQALRFMRQSPDDFAAAMRRFGMNDTTRVVTYSSANVWWATRLWWLLHEFGHDNAAVLNGGWQKWQNEGRPVETGPARPRQPGNYTVREVRNLMVGKDDVLRAVGDGAICTINALQPAQHTGSGGNSYGRPGHIAGSVNLPAAHLLDPATNTFLPADELRRRFEAIGAMDRQVINYCGGGIAASADALALIMLGHKDVKLYDASLSEWAKDPALPMETG